MPDTYNKEALLQQNQQLHARLEELEETLRAIRSGEVDALVVSRPEGEQVYTLRGALEPYRVMVEVMSEGAVTLALDGSILYTNSRFAELVKTPQEKIIGQPLQDWVALQDRDKYAAMLGQGRKGIARDELALQASDGTQVPANFSMCTLPESAGKGIAVVITDLTDVIATAEARSRLALMIESSDDAIVTTTLDGVVTSWNRAAERLYGYTAEEAVGGPIQKLIVPPDRVGEITQKLNIIRSGEHMGHTETVRRRKDGTLVDVSATASPINDAAGNIVGMSLILRDITEHKRAEEALLESEEKFKYMFEHSPIGKSITSPDGEIHVNKAFCEMLGYSEEELTKLRWQDITHPDDIEMTQKALAPLLAGRQESARFNKRYLHKSGAVVWADVSTSLRRDDAGKPLYFMTNVMDITQNKKAEESLRLSHERLRRFIDSNVIGIVIATAAGDIVEANDYYLRLIGFTREELEQGKVDWRAITPPEWLPVDELALRELRERGTCTPYEKEYIRRDGSRVPVLLADAILPGPEEQIAAFALDITGRKQAEEVMRTLNTELEQRVVERTANLEAANQELEAFAYSVSHDLRAPLRAIDGFSRKIVMNFGDKVGDEGQRQLQVVRDNAQRMGKLIDDLLAFSRMGRREMEAQPLDMNALANSVVEELRTAEPQRSIEFAIAPLPPAFGDAALLREVWANLLGNAVKFTRRREVAHIEIGGRVEDGEALYWVKDDGAGFDMQYADKLFGVFQRLHRQDEFEGTGVGLAIAQRILHRHHGRIWGEGKPEAGATFSFALPLSASVNQRSGGQAS